MHVKNISSSQIKIEDLSLSLSPGDTIDLSSYDSKILRTHTKLNLYFDKGLLANLGSIAKTPGTKASLLATKQKIEKLGIMGTDNVIKPASRSSVNKRKMIGDVIRKADPNKRLSAPPKSFNPEKERYREEYLYNSKGGIDYDVEEDFYEAPERTIEIEEKFIPRQIAWDGSFHSKGVIKTGQLTGETTHLSFDKQKLENMKDSERLFAERQTKSSDLIVTDSRGVQHKVSFEEVKRKVLKRCIGITSAGKPCQKYAIQGFQSCIKHMSLTEKQEYNKLKHQEYLDSKSRRENKK